MHLSVIKIDKIQFLIYPMNDRIFKQIILPACVLFGWRLKPYEVDGLFVGCSIRSKVLLPFTVPHNVRV